VQHEKHPHLCSRVIIINLNMKYILCLKLLQATQYVGQSKPKQ